MKLSLCGLFRIVNLDENYFNRTYFLHRKKYCNIIDKHVSTYSNPNPHTKYFQH